MTKAPTTARAWHIYHYAELFRAVGGNGSELEIVKYSQRPIVGFSEFAEQHCQQIDALRQTLPFEGFVMARHVFEELLDMSQKHHRDNKYLRGFILDERLRPAGAARIGQMVGCGTKTAEKYLKILERVGLIDRCEVPDAPGQPADPLPTEPKKTPSKSPVDTPKKTRKKAAGGRKKAETSTKWNSSDSAVTLLQESAKGSEKEKEKEKPRPSASAEREEKNKVGLSASKAEGKAETEGNAEAEGQTEGTADAVPRPKGQAEREDHLEQQDPAEGEGLSRTPSTPAATPPILPTGPTETDGGGTADINLNAYLERLYDRTGEGFATAIYAAIGTPGPPDSPEGARQMAAFASVWQKTCVSGLTPSVLNDVYDKAVRQAAQLGKKRRRNPKAFRKSPEAVWTAKFNGLVSSMRGAAGRNVKSC